MRPGARKGHLARAHSPCRSGGTGGRETPGSGGPELEEALATLPPRMAAALREPAPRSTDAVRALGASGSWRYRVAAVFGGAALTALVAWPLGGTMAGVLGGFGAMFVLGVALLSTLGYAREEELFARSGQLVVGSVKYVHRSSGDLEEAVIDVRSPAGDRLWTTCGATELPAAFKDRRPVPVLLHPGWRGQVAVVVQSEGVVIDEARYSPLPRQYKGG